MRRTRANLTLNVACYSALSLTLFGCDGDDPTPPVEDAGALSPAGAEPPFAGAVAGAMVTAGAEPPPAGAELPPAGAELHPAGAEPPPAGAEPPPAGAEVMAGAEPPPAGAEPPPAGAEAGAELPPAGAEVMAGEEVMAGAEVPELEGLPWCKLFSSETSSVSSGTPVNSVTTCTWEELTQTCDVGGYTTNVTTYNPQGYALRTESTSNGATQVTTYTYDCALGWCQMLSTAIATSANTQTTTCRWDELVQTCLNAQGVPTVTTYNERGSATLIELESGAYTSRVEMTYDCSGPWCKLLDTTSTSGTNGNLSTTHATCTWVDNTQTCVEPETQQGFQRVSTYNDYGQLLTMNIMSMTVTANTTQTYECP